MNENGNELVGYKASNTVTATIRKLGDAGDVVDAAVGAGANQVSGPNLLASDQDAAYRTHRAESRSGAGAHKGGNARKRIELDPRQDHRHRRGRRRSRASTARREGLSGCRSSRERRRSKRR